MEEVQYFLWIWNGIKVKEQITGILSLVKTQILYQIHLLLVDLSQEELISSNIELEMHMDSVSSQMKSP